MSKVSEDNQDKIIFAIDSGGGTIGSGDVQTNIVYINGERVDLKKVEASWLELWI